MKFTQLMPWTLKIEFGISFYFEEKRSVGAVVGRRAEAFSGSTGKPMGDKACENSEFYWMDLVTNT